MEYIIGAIVGAVIFAAGFFVARKTMCVGEEEKADKTKEQMDEGLKDYIKQYNNFMNYNGRPMG